MPEVLKYENEPAILSEFNIEPFRQEYIPGSRVLCHEASDGYDVYFQIPSPIFYKSSKDELNNIKKQIHSWWLEKAKK
jgi:hypothetical protein